MGIALDPIAAGKIDLLAPGLNGALSLILLAILPCYLFWVWNGHRIVGYGDWKIRLPGGPATLIQIAIGMVDMTCCGLAMYCLLPATPSISLPALLVVFVAAILLGYASHTPGGLGVFDAAMLLALDQFEKEPMLASLLLFRLLCYVIPFVLAATLLGGRQLFMTMKSRIADDTGSKPA